MNLPYTKIKDIGKRNGYDNRVIDKLIEEMKRPKQDKTKDKHIIKKQNRCLTLQYYPKFYERIKYRLARYDIKITANNALKLSNLIERKIDPINNDQQAGVYQIPFTKVNGPVMYYIGMTGRKFETRKKEHKADIKYNKTTTALARLNNSEPIEISFENSKIIYPSQNYQSTIIREAIEIFTRSDNVCNDSAAYNIPNIWKETLRRTFSK